MDYKYSLPSKFIEEAQYMEEFANGATQVTIELQDGSIFEKVLLSHSKYIIAIRDYLDLPFDVNQIKKVFQGGDDKNPKIKNNWSYWDDWNE